MAARKLTRSPELSLIHICGDKDHRIPPTDEDGNTVTGKALDSWTRDVNLDPWKAEVCAMSLSAACDEARAIFIDNPGANQFEPGLSRSEARKRLFDTLEQYFFTNHKICLLYTSRCV